MENNRILKTEMRNPYSMHIDQMTTGEMIACIQRENEKAVAAVGAVSEQIEKACDTIANHLSEGGRLVYVGAGTSGRLGVLDAAECPPTFGVPRDLVIGIIAGGEKCLSQAAEQEEDHAEFGERDLKEHKITEKDVIVGIYNFKISRKNQYSALIGLDIIEGSEENEFITTKRYIRKYKKR